MDFRRALVVFPFLFSLSLFFFEETPTAKRTKGGHGYHVNRCTFTDPYGTRRLFLTANTMTNRGMRGPQTRNSSRNIDVMTWGESAPIELASQCRKIKLYN